MMASYESTNDKRLQKYVDTLGIELKPMVSNSTEIKGLKVLSTSCERD